MYDVTTRDIPSRSLLCLKRNVDGQQGAWALGKQFVALLRERALPRMEGRTGAAFCIYWAEVSDDSDGPIEWCRPVPGDRAEALATQFPELTLRTEAARGVRQPRRRRADQSRPVAAGLGVAACLGRRARGTSQRAGCQGDVPRERAGHRGQRAGLRLRGPHQLICPGYRPSPTLTRAVSSSRKVAAVAAGSPPGGTGRVITTTLPPPGRGITRM
jgi:hypothetical protein